MVDHLIILLLSFAFLWIGSGMAVGSIAKVATSLHKSSFFVSFILLGVLTSMTEIVVGTSAFIANQPEVYIGNLIGSSMVVFLLIAPVLAVLGNGISLNHTFSFDNLRMASFVVGIPAVMTLDNDITVLEGVVMVLLYIFLLVNLGKSNSLPSKIPVENIKKRNGTVVYFGKIVLAVILIILGAKLLIDQTMFFGQLWNIPTFIVSLVLISVGTNIPELSIGIRALLAKRKGIAFGNYVGSAAFNTLQLGSLSLLYGKTTPAEGSNYSVLLYLAGLVCFLYYAKSRNQLSQKEGVILLGFYILLVICEFVTGPGWKFV